MSRCFVSVLLAVLLASASARGQQSAASSAPSPGFARLAGCYGLHLGSWSDSATAYGPTGLRLHPMRMPSVVYLDTLAHARVPTHLRRLSPQSPDLEGERAIPPGWRPISPDSVELIWSAGFTGIRVMALALGDTLRGYAETFSDVRGSPQPRAFAQLERTLCPILPKPDSVRLLHN